MARAHARSRLASGDVPGEGAPARGGSVVIASVHASLSLSSARHTTRTEPCQIIAPRAGGPGLGEVGKTEVSRRAVAVSTRRRQDHNCRTS